MDRKPWLYFVLYIYLAIIHVKWSKLYLRSCVANKCNIIRLKQVTSPLCMFLCVCVCVCGYTLLEYCLIVIYTNIMILSDILKTK